MNRNTIPLLLAAALLAASPALAASNPKLRAKLMKEIDGHLVEILEHVDDTSDTNENRSKAAFRPLGTEIQRLKTKLRDLGRVQGRDRTAKDRARNWPRLVQKLSESVDRLQRLKGLQYAFDDLTSRCGDREKLLEKALARPGDLDNVVQTARKLGRPVKASLDKAPQVLREVQRDLDAVKRFNERGDWQKISQALRDSATDASAYAKRAYRVAEGACRNLAKEEKHPEVVKLLDQMRDVDTSRAALLAEMDEAVEDIAQLLVGFEDDRDAQSLRNVKRISARIKLQIRELRRLAEEDKLAIERAKEWPAATMALESSIETLEEMKDVQFLADDLPGRCAKASGRLRSKITDYTRGAGKPEGIFELPELGIELGEPLARAYLQTRELVKRMGSAAALVQRFDGHDGWEEVEDALHSESDAIWVYLDEVLDDAAEKCHKIVLEDANPDIVAAVDKLEVFKERELNDFNATAGRWLADSRHIFAQNCEVLEAVWVNHCGLDAEAHEGFDRARLAAAKRPVLEADIDRKIDAMRGRFRDLKVEADSLTDPKTYPNADFRKKAQKIFDQATERLADLMAIRAKFLDLKGNQAPLRQFATKYGIQAHKRMEGENSCDIADQTIVKGRPDCIQAGACMVLEFKPNNAAAKAKGEKQLKSDPNYVKNVQNYYSDFLPVDQMPINAPPAALGGIEIMRKFHDNGCIRNGRLKVKGRVKTYKMCKVPYSCNPNP